MAEVNFYLKKPQNHIQPEGRSQKNNGKTRKKERHLIYLQFKYNGKKLVYSFGQTINPNNWNYDKQRVKSNTLTTDDGKHSLNDLLDNLQRVCKSAYNKEIKNGIPQPAVLRKHLIDFMNQNEESVEDVPTLFKLIDRFIADDIKHKGRDKSKNTLKTYETVKNHLYEFQYIKKEKVDFDTITLDFYYKYVDFLHKRDHYEKQIEGLWPKVKNKIVKNLGDNSISKDIQILKVFMNEAVDLGFTTNLQFKHKKFAVSRCETDAVYLTEEEIISLYNFDFSDNNKLEQVRDLFVFGCFVGLRFSDYSDIQPENINTDTEGDTFITKVTKKTNELVMIPCHPIVLDIFKKYEKSPNRLPKSISIQNFNRYIKEVCEVAGFKEKGRLASAPELELYKCISSHTARRNFATNYYIAGIPAVILMKITGHKTEKAFLTYIRVSKLESAKLFNKQIKKNWDEKMMKMSMEMNSR